ncbi:MAG: hypothetical protein LAT56_07495 [Wenzhouxiangella sp.]|nr:hypothetical protein [Wenzhouxiangella sp.]
MTHSRHIDSRKRLASLALLTTAGLALVLIIGMGVHTRTEPKPASAATTGSLPSRADELRHQSRAAGEPVLVPLFLPPR